MDFAHFDRLTRIVSITLSRRGVMGAAGLATLLGTTRGDARKRKKKRRHKKRRRDEERPPQPVEELDANCPAASGAGHVANIPAITFQPGRSGLLTRARVLLHESQAGQDFEVALTPVDAAGLPAEPALAIAEVLDLPQTGPGNSPQPLAVTYTDPVFVFKGTRYALVVLSEQGFQLALGQTEQCPDSLAYDDTNRDGVFTPFPDRDFAFETFIYA
jgi:hypothetical protein